MTCIEISVSRMIPASPGEVFDVWLDRNNPGGPWFGAERVIINPVVDGLFYHCVRHEGRAWAHYGRFVRLDRPRVIEHTWVSQATRGIESTVTVRLEPKGNETLLTLRHSDVPDDAMGRRHEEGWTFVVGAIRERFAAPHR
jgi:uncharacterized protein YndB with AHSA1/START domain